MSDRIVDLFIQYEIDHGPCDMWPEEVEAAFDKDFDKIMRGMLE